MNAIELQIWKNHERADQDEMARNIAMAEEALESRRQFVLSLFEALGDFADVLISGPVRPVKGTWKFWLVPIEFNGVTGRIESQGAGRSRLSIHMPTEYAYLENIDKPTGLAAWLEKWAK